MRLPITIRNFRRKALWGLAALLLSIGGYQAVIAQPGMSPNFAWLRGAALGSDPALVCQGLDTNVDCNVVPQGTGQLLVNGSPVAIGGGTLTSLNINPGPLNVTGTTNLTGPLFVQPGTAATLKLAGARIAHNVVDAATTGLVIETLYTFTVEANTLAVNGQSLGLEVVATTAANANNKTLTLVYGATTIGTLGPVAANGENFRVTCRIYRTGAVTQKAICEGTHKANADVGGTASFGINQFSTPGETLSGATTLLVRGTTPTAIGDLTARVATLDWKPVGQ